MASRRSAPSAAIPGQRAEPGPGPVPPANEPGHHDEHDQDKPVGRRPKPRAASAAPPAGKPAKVRFSFAYEGTVGRVAQGLRLDERHAFVEVDDADLTARFGPWGVRTPLTNVADLAITGPYAGWKVVGPPHLSFADRGLTFGTTTTRGVCIRFHEPVVGMEPTGRLRHPALTVTLRDPEHFIATIVARTVR